ncbi:helix-turn-helix domain-containing protein [Cribrihabitans marinus]|uniref:helix-turn-helix domain-containing protein n=1 Tax=Cribrihabitans marinus TaxID=1227549 RepID=UPI000B8A0455|nr:AraC family transcriptional regulator [Cribrihabitans marinus]
MSTAGLAQTASERQEGIGEALTDEPQRLQNIRDGTLHDYTFRKHDIVVTPAGVRSGWRWFEQSDVIVVTLDPKPVERFAQTELGMLLDARQFQDMPQFSDPDLCAAGIILRDALEHDNVTSGVMFEAMSRVFLVKLLQKYGDRRREDVELSASFTSDHYARVLAFIRSRLDKTITVDELASEAGMSKSHFNRVFKETLGATPMQYVMAYRIEQSVKMLDDPARPLGEIAYACGFADQAHFSRSFKQITGKSPRAYRAAGPTT